MYICTIFKLEIREGGRHHCNLGELSRLEVLGVAI